VITASGTLGQIIPPSIVLGKRRPCAIDLVYSGWV